MSATTAAATPTTTPTTPTTAAPASGPVPARPAARRRLRVLAALPMLLAVLLGSLGLAAPAQAAGNYSTAMSFCTNVTNNSVQLLKWNGASWVVVKNGKTNSSGCGTWRYLDAGGYYAVQHYSTSGQCGNPAMWVLQGVSGYAQAQLNRTVSVGYFSVSSRIIC